MKRNYYIFSSGVLKRKNYTLQFIPNKEIEPYADDNEFEEIMLRTREKDEKEYSKDSKSIPINDIESICVLADVTFNKRFLEFIASNKIPMHIFNFYGTYKGTFYPPDEIFSGSLLVKQVKFFIRLSRRIYIARKFVLGAANNIRRNLKRYASKAPEIVNIISQIEEKIKEIDHSKDIPSLMNIEGAIHKLYYSAFNFFINSEIKFTKREFHPPTTPMNALISFANALVYSSIANEIYRTKLSPLISFLHEPADNRLSLVFDIAEIFKPLLGDRLIFKMLNQNSITIKDFEYRNQACYLNETGRKKFVEAYDKRLEKTIVHRQLKREVSYRRLIRLECYKIIKHIQKLDDYKPFIIWW